MNLLDFMDIYGPLAGEPEPWTIPPIDDFVLTDKLHDTNVMTNIDATPKKVTLRVIENTAAVEGTVTITNAWGNTRPRTIPPKSKIQGFFNIVHATGLSGISDSDLVGYV